MKNTLIALLFFAFAQAAGAAQSLEVTVTVTEVDPESTAAIAVPSAGSIKILGPVKNPGQIEVEEEISVSDAIAAAGGYTPISSRTEFTITSTNGTQMRWRGVSFDSTEGKELCSRIMIKAGDILFVPERCVL